MLRSITVVSLLALSVGVMQAHAQSADGTFANPRHFVIRDGGVLYRSICQGCHMPDGRGAVGAGRYPALAANEKLENAGYPVFIVLHGQKGMPGFGYYLDDAQVAAVVNYVRTHFGNAYADTVAPDDVKAVR
jgi:mono/diheme cytochrome c family protein